MSVESDHRHENVPHLLAVQVQEKAHVVLHSWESCKHTLLWNVAFELNAFSMTTRTSFTMPPAACREGSFHHLVQLIFRRCTRMTSFFVPFFFPHRFDYWGENPAATLEAKSTAAGAWCGGVNHSGSLCESKL